MKPNNNKHYCIICVNPTMSLDITFKEIKQRKYKIFSIITGLKSNKINVSYVNDNSDYFFNGSHNVNDDYPEIYKLVNQNNLEIKAVINGIDASIYYSDYLISHLMGINLDLNYSQIRLNKFEVNNVLVNNNINAIQSLELSSVNITPEIAIKIKQFGWPLIVKPSENTAAMAGFRIIQNQTELDEYLSNTFGRKNAYYEDYIVIKIILQKYIPMSEYDEYVLDFISYNGSHYLQAIGCYEKELVTGSNQLIYRNAHPAIINEIPNIQFVIDYMISVLDALKVQYGSTHNEVFWDHKNSCYLIESNPRMVGSGLAEAYLNCYGYSPLSNFLNIIDHKPIQSMPTHKISHSMVMFLHNFYCDTSKYINLDGIKSLQSIVTFYHHKKTTIMFHNYTRADDIAAAILLNNTDLNQLNMDITELINRERNGMLFYNKKLELVPNT